jgi:hypothetical protein
MSQIVIEVKYSNIIYHIRVQYSIYIISAIIYILHMALKTAKFAIRLDNIDITKQIRLYTLMEPYCVDTQQTADQIANILQTHKINIFKQDGREFYPLISCGNHRML